jgi:hypothetical protein
LLFSFEKIRFRFAKMAIRLRAGRARLSFVCAICETPIILDRSGRNSPAKSRRLIVKNNGFERLGLTLGESGIEQTMHDVPWLFRAGFGDRGSIRPIPV